MLIGLAILALIVTVVPFTVDAQQGKLYRVGFLGQGSQPPPGSRGVFVSALRELGYVEGHNLVLDRRSAAGQNERFAVLANANCSETRRDRR